MHKIKKDRLLLLKVLRDHVKESLNNSEINPAFEEDVADMFLAIQDRKNVKQLKVVEKELEKWIDEMENQRATR